MLVLDVPVNYGVSAQEYTQDVKGFTGSTFRKALQKFIFNCKD